MNVSIIIPTILANPDLLEACKDACMATAPEAEIVVVEDKATFAENCNRGALMSNRGILVFLNDDTEPQPGWLEALIEPLKDDVGITGAKLCYPRFNRSGKVSPGDIQHAGIYFDAPDGILTAHNHLEDHGSRDVDAVTGACLAITRELFNDCTGFDPGYRSGYEDVDLCLRVRAGGWRVRYVAESVVVHHESQSGEARWAYTAQNIARLQEMWSVRAE